MKICYNACHEALATSEIAAGFAVAAFPIKWPVMVKSSTFAPTNGVLETSY
jgi:hypothetical protein